MYLHRTLTGLEGNKKERVEREKEDLNLGFEAGFHYYRAGKRHKKESSHLRTSQP